MSGRRWVMASVLVALGCGSGEPPATDAAAEHLNGDGGDATADVTAAGPDAAVDVANGERGASDAATDDRASGDAAVEAVADGGGDAASPGDAPVGVADAAPTDSRGDVNAVDGAGPDGIDGQDAGCDARADGGSDVAADGGGDAPPWQPCQVGSRWFDFSYPVAAIAYSRVLDLLVVLPSTERSVHIVDPETCSDRKVELRRRGLSVSIAASGRTAAIGADGEVSIINLALGQLVASYPVSHPAS